jgi:MFS transporter, DHA2 family, multidrug resistance protein
MIYGMFSPLLRQRLQEAGATPGEQAQAIGILQSYVPAGDTDKFDARLVHEVIASGTSAYLASFRVTMLAMAALIASIALLCLWLLPRRADAH